jgi:GNAT superfamily N-acetyltransferase
VPDLEVHPLTAERWADAVTVFGTRGDPARCWCQWFRLTGAQWGSTRTPARRAALSEQAAATPPPGVVAYVHGEPQGWCAVAPRPAYARLRRAQVLRGTGAEELADASVWSVTCFVVRVGARRRGLSAALLAGAVELAAGYGAASVEAYPVDPSAREGVVSSSELYHGVLGVFLAARFREVARPLPARPVVRLDL